MKEGFWVMSQVSAMESWARVGGKPQSGRWLLLCLRFPGVERRSLVFLIWPLQRVDRDRSSKKDAIRSWQTHHLSVVICCYQGWIVFVVFDCFIQEAIAQPLSYFVKVALSVQK